MGLAWAQGCSERQAVLTPPAGQVSSGRAGDGGEAEGERFPWALVMMRVCLLVAATPPRGCLGTEPGALQSPTH